MKSVGTQLKELGATVNNVFNDPIKGFGVLSEYAIKRASLMTGIDRPKSHFAKVVGPLRPYANIFEDGARELAAAADRILRTYGKNIVGQQFETKRMADIMIDLFALACVLSRVDTEYKEKGPKAIERELQILRVFAHGVKDRIDYNFSKIDDNEDDAVRAIAAHAFDIEGYGWDNV